MGSNHALRHVRTGFLDLNHLDETLPCEIRYYISVSFWVKLR